VQGFIAAARKTKDLKAGSDMLVEIGRQLAYAVEEMADDVAWVFPADPKKGGPNIMQFTAKTESPDQFVSHCRTSAAQAFSEWFASVPVPNLKDEPLSPGVLEQKKFNEWFRRAAQTQFIEYFEFFAAWEAFPVESQYMEVQRRLGHRFSSRKGIRDFSPVSTTVFSETGWRPSGHFGAPLSEQGTSTATDRVVLHPKSPLLPELDSILPCWGPGFTLSDGCQTKYKLRAHEHLDAISLLKRYWPPVSVQRDTPTVNAMKFPSTRVVAVNDASRVSPLFNDLAISLKGADYDIGDLLLGNAELEGIEVRTEHLESAKALKQDLEASNYSCRPYYAVIHADGDSMGALFGQCNSSSDHTKLSRKLSNEFADEVANVVEKHDGFTVYSGGDDVLALVPMLTCLDCACELQALFSTAVENGSLSAGIALAHVGENLQHAVERSRLLEKEHAKKLPGKAAVAIGALPRRGGWIIYRSRGQATEGTSETDVRFLQRVCDAFKVEGSVSRRFPYKLRNEALLMASVKGSEISVRAAYLRLVEKSEISDGTLSTPPDWLKSAGDLQKFANAMIIAHFMTRGDNI
jgi:CRISPR-associated protein Cmr2